MSGLRSPQHIEILHLAYTRFPADTRVKREITALQTLGRRIAVVALRIEGERAVERSTGLTIIRVPGRKSRGGVVSYLLEYVAFVWRCRRLVARHRALAHVQVVHVHTLPDFLLWAALPAQRRGARVVFDMHEIFPEFIKTKFTGILGWLTAPVALYVDRWARRRADLTITVNRPIDELLRSRPIVRPEHRLVLHNTADPADFGQTGSQSPSARSGLDLIYHGTLTGLYGVDVAIRAVKEARDQGLRVRFTVLGDGPERGALERLVTDLQLSDAVTFEVPIVQSALPARLRRSSAGVVPTRLDGMTRYSLSNKLLEYIHLGIPILAARLPSYSRYLDDNAVWYWQPGDPKDFARAIRDFAASPMDERAARARRARDGVAPYEWAREREGLVSAYADLLARTGNRFARNAAIRAAAVPSP